MPEQYAVICTCGYTTLVHGSAFGTSVECMNCGAELEVDESSAAPSRPAEDAAPIEGEYDQGLPESPLVVHTPFESGPKEGPASPFEDETERSEIRPHDSEHPLPSPAARSPFEEEGEETEHESPSGPFTLEPAPESRDTSFAERIEAERPKTSNQHVIIETESPLDKKTGEKCGDCGREIRGDWDRFQTPEGVICYICSNQATHGMPQRMQTNKGQRELAGDDYLLEIKTAPPEHEHAPWYFDPQSDTFRRVLLVFAFSTVGIALFVNFFDIGTPSPEALERAPLQTSESAEEIQLPLFVQIIVWGLRILSLYIGFLVAAYLALDHNNRLPYDTLKSNVAYIGLVLLVLTGIQLITLLLYFALGEIFVAGQIWAMLVAGLSGLIQIRVVTRMLDYGFRDWFWTVLYLILSQIILQSISFFIYAGIYRLVS